MDKKQLKKKVEISLAASVASFSILTATMIDNPSELFSTYQDDDKNHLVLASKDKKQASPFINKIPLWIKVFLIIPLWALGSLLLKIVKPFTNLFLRFIVTFLVLSLITYIVMKLLFPDLKFKDIFNKRTIIILLVTSFVLTIASLLLPLLDKEYRNFIIVVDFVGGLLGLTITLLPLIIIKKKINSLF